MLDLQQSSRMRLALGLLIACVVPAIFVPHWPWLPNSYILRNWVSVAVVACSYVATVFSLRKLKLFPGMRSAVAGVPLLLNVVCAGGVGAVVAASAVQPAIYLWRICAVIRLDAAAFRHLMAHA